MKKLTFDKFQDTDPWQKKIKKGAMAYAADPQGWFLICGQSGSGKTHICTAICQQLLSQHREVQYMSWLEESARLKTMLLEDPERRIADIAISCGFCSPSHFGSHFARHLGCTPLQYRKNI